ncbi:ATP-binding protein [Frankia canadensis]|uniref:histidine kinase n=1 Tax=Frankia canadensis TaxID=1836972 RepID=A0A2I2KT90_9ACTN|nr:ATP-binding protein [Frankia canadensis]SNQ48875.1 ATP-binding protein [Frankia canadensis]SOU56165.1 ATP-binding protein [Frankia canadensis]
MRADELRTLSVFAGLTDPQLGQLAEDGAELSVQPGVELFREGEPADHWWVLVEGALDLERHIGREKTVVSRMDVPGRWAGGFRAWDEQGIYLATGRGAKPGRVLRIPAAALRDRVDTWFPFGSHLLQGVYGTARSIEATARQRESLVALGTLAAGLAHGINNPAAAATRAVDDLAASCETLLCGAVRLAGDGLTGGQLAALDELRREIATAAASHDPLALADREDDLSSWLMRHDVDRDWILAPTLAAAGADVAWCERAAAVLGEAALGPGLEWVAGALSTTTLLAELKESTQRISGLVSAIKSYSQMDRASMQHIDVTDGLESTLIVLGTRVGDGVTVERDYAAGLPRIPAHAGELNQVWTSLIDNALDAMNGSGTLRLTLRADPDAVVVEVADTGPGMPPEVAARAFDAFFTTKGVGEGAGLGLDIARRIVVERHTGTITIDSAPGRTVLCVRLPTGR